MKIKISKGFIWGYAVGMFMMGVFCWVEMSPRAAFEDGVKVGCIEGVKMYKSGITNEPIPVLMERARAFPGLPERYKP